MGGERDSDRVDIEGVVGAETGAVIGAKKQAEKGAVVRAEMVVETGVVIGAVIEA